MSRSRAGERELHAGGQPGVDWVVVGGADDLVDLREHGGRNAAGRYLFSKHPAALVLAAHDETDPASRELVARTD